ncbi:PAS modulated sigma54 specific transcriptional regulator, Fis family [Candidatus Vecturithrix granuli]|uniref:PAS modulated sigma54 specific transcriptional regulator, Fis family n=1 Tax=Vecturithrix granuli TaxID=1499967 RepID=A0A081C7Y8_VECG1|nr:PAS modulated sigma54 specific transcriptional regulator, Fis family [Candidatus Vecturithrix granuli]
MKWNLRVKILFSAGVIIFVVLGTSTLIHIYGVQQDYLEALEWRSEALAQGLIKKAQDLTNIAPDFNSNDLLELLGYWVKDVYESNLHLTHIAAIDAEGIIAAHTEKALWDTPITSPVLHEALSRQQQVTVLDGAIYHMLFPIRSRQALYLGSIAIGVPKQIIDVKAQQILRHSIALFALFLGLAVLATSVSGHLLTKPINHLVSIAQELAEGNLAQPILITNRSDEIGVLARSFANMRDRIKRQIEDLHRLNDELEQRVEERTAELAREKYIVDTFLANVPDSIYFKEPEGRIIRANTAHARRRGLCDPREEVGKTDFDFFPEEVAQRKYAQEQQIIRTGTPVINVEEQNVWSDGRIDWQLTTKMPLRNEHGEIIGIFGISRDITELKQAEQELERYRDRLEDLVAERTAELTRMIEESKRLNARLHEENIERRRVENVLRVSEEQYRMLAENVKDGIVIVQKDQLVFANKAFAVMTGYRVEQSEMPDPLRLFHDRAIPSIRAGLHAEDQDNSVSEWQVEVIVKDGHTIWTEIEQTEIVWNDQPALLLTIRDITERKRQEQRLEEERVRLKEENLHLKSTIKDRYRFGALVGKSLAMQRVYELIVNAAAAEVNVLLCGESGTGKELIARTLHQVSRRKMQPFVPVNCASIPESLFEREFFGHRKGAFTGADRNTPGLFDRAHQGILFLDEVTELSPGAQAKLLRVLQDGEYTPLGSTTPKQADVLIIAATNQNCQKEMAQERLRKDFFYRIGVIEIAVPPLRDRKEDLPLLIEHILEEYREKQAQVQGSAPADLPADQTMLPAELVQALYASDWPGNVRELQNVLQRYLVTRNLEAVLPLLGVAASPRAATPFLLHPEPLPSTLPEAVQLLEKRMITHTLAQTEHRIGKTAEKLGMPLRTLQYKIKKYQLL